MKKLLSSVVLLFLCSFAFSQITLTSTVTNASCFGTSNGSATISATGGTAAYTYTWLPTNTHSNIITGLAAGSYTVYAEDAVATTNSLVVIIGEPAQLTAVTSVTNANCGASNGALCVNTTGGAGAYTSFWSNGATTSCINLIPAGVYTYTVIDINGCVASSSVSVTSIGGPTVSISSQTNVSCFGGCTGLATASVSGTPPFAYNWSNGQVTAAGTNLCAGTYTVSVTDNAGCVGITTFNITQPSQLNAIVNAINVRCFGTATGSLSAAGSGGTAPYSYFWPAISSTLAINPNISAGNYQVNVTDANGCFTNGNVNVMQPTQLNAVVSITNTPCFGSCAGSAMVTAFGGTGGPYTFVWNNGANSPYFTNLCVGVYQCVITDANLCTSTKTVVITQPPQMTFNINTSNASCNGTCNGTATLSVTGGVPAYSYTSQPLGITSNVNSNLCVGNYTVIVQDANGCFETTIFYISPNGGSLPNATITTTSYNESCYLSGDGSIDLNISGTNPGPFTYLWSNGAVTQDITNVQSNNYWVNILDGSSNCMAIIDTISSIGVNCGTIAGNIFIDNNSDCIKNTGDNNLNNVQIIVNPGNRFGYTNPNGDYTVNNLPYGSYTVTANTNTVTYIATCITVITSSVNSGSPNSINNNFTREYTPLTQPDLYVSAFSNGIVPGFVCTVNYYLNNYYTFIASGIYKVTLPSTFIPNITQVSASTYTISGDTIMWNFTNITSTNNTSFFVKFTTPLSTPLGSAFTSCIWAQPTVTDLNYANNTYCYSRTVMGSFDPNDKTVSPVGIGANGDIAATETNLSYLIRFQNTGNGPAVNIVVKDTLSANVDINTFEMLGSSHNYNIDILPGNILRWKFNNIMLPDSNSNEPGSHGYIQYRIKRTNNNTPGTQIKNTAYIYFDFNEPVVTNTAINTIETITGLNSQNIANDQWLIYPNPSTGILNLINNSIAPDTKLHIQIVNAFGQLVYEENNNADHKTMDLTKLSNGVYFVKLVSDKQNSVKRIVLSK